VTTTKNAVRTVLASFVEIIPKTGKIPIKIANTATTPIMKKIPNENRSPRVMFGYLYTIT
jgi:hypothetical protein